MKISALFLALAATLLTALTAAAAAAQNFAPCARFTPGSVIREPEDLYSQNGVLTVSLLYEHATANGATRFCYMTPDGHESPTLHVRPGDRLVLTLTNDTPNPGAATAMEMQMSPLSGAACGATVMNDSSTNVHFHGMNIAPVCGQDEVIHTLVNAGQSFTYDVQIPRDEPAGLYWYHPHVHGMSEAAGLGGASGAIIVDGIQRLQPELAGIPWRLLVVRDYLVPGNPTHGGPVPSWDLSLNFTPVPYPNYQPVIIPMQPEAKQLWRLLNASADTILDVQLLYDGAPQPLGVVALDGVPTGSQDGTRHGRMFTTRQILLPPAGRAEFVVTGPATTVDSAFLVTRNIDTGPDGDDDPARPLALIKTSIDAPQPGGLPVITSNPPKQRFEGLATAIPTATRKLYFSEVLSDPGDPDSPTDFYITVDGQTPTLFSPNNPPAIVTTQGSVEDWTIENRAEENHEFHIHQIHFLLLGRNGKPVPPDQRQFLDTIQIPYWQGSGPYPSVTVRMDFRGPDTGDFVYHCHILGHEDAGMMAIIRVLPKSAPPNSWIPSAAKAPQADAAS